MGSFFDKNSFLDKVRIRKITSLEKRSSDGREVKPSPEKKVDRTLILIKPDAVVRGLEDEIIKYFREQGLDVLMKKNVVFDEDLVKKFYPVLLDKLDLLKRTIEFFKMSHVIAIVLEGENALNVGIEGKKYLREKYHEGHRGSALHSSDSVVDFHENCKILDISLPTESEESD